MSNGMFRGPSARTQTAQSTTGTGTGPRRVAGRLRPLTRAEKRARQLRRLRNNAEREVRKTMERGTRDAERRNPRRRLRPDWFARVAGSMR